MKELLGKVPAVILAGGKGERLGLKDRPKPLVMVAGKPIAQYQLEEFADAGIGLTVFATGHLGEQFRQKFMDAWDLSMGLSYSHEETPLGRGGALKQALLSIGEDWDYAIVRNGDNIAPGFNFAQFLDLHIKDGALLTMALVKKRASESSGYGIVDINNERRITGFREKPKDLREGISYINAGIYAVTRTLVEKLPDVGDHETELFPELVKQGLIFGFPVSNWITVDNPQDLQQAEVEFSRGFWREKRGLQEARPGL